ncbi:MAG: pentapeptide repeat-containing protein, partial [Thermoguttaceae bacterium]|nr:pentapeptide repeat-containing protein [Thermoguttaceae bacterium]
MIKLTNGLNLRCLDLVGAQINNIILEDVDFGGCDFTRADLRQAYFVRCDFSLAILRDVKTDEYTRFIDCKFHNASFGGNDVQRYPREPFVASLLTVEQLKSTNSFSKKINPGFYQSIHNWNAIPTMAFKDCADYDFTDIALQGEFRNLTAEQLKQTQNFQAGVYEHIAIGRSGDQRRLLDYKNFDFRKAILRNCLFRNVDLTGADFTDAVLYDCKFHERTIITLEQLQSTWNWK